LLAVSDWDEAQGNHGPIWCFDGEHWLPFFEGVPGSSTREEITECLASAADQETVFRFDAQLVPGGTLIDVGESSLFWARARSRARTIVDVILMAYDDRVVFKDSCDRKLEVSSGIPTMTADGFPCIGTRIEIDPRAVTTVDFTMYVANRQFIIDGPDGWYHVRLHGLRSSKEKVTPGEVTLVGLGGVWATTRYIVRDLIHEPVAGTLRDRQQWRVYDWGARVEQELIPRSFDLAWHYLLPDYDAYRKEAQGWLDAMLYDLYGGEVEPVELTIWRTLAGGGYASGRTIGISSLSTYVIMHEFAHVIAEAEQSHDENFAAMWLML
jgi:hypothetical protein